MCQSDAAAGKMSDWEYVMCPHNDGGQGALFIQERCANGTQKTSRCMSNCSKIS